MKISIKSNKINLNFNEQKAKLDVSLGSDGNVVFDIDNEGAPKIDKPGEYEYSSVHFFCLEATEQDYKSIINIAQVTNKRNIGFLFVSAAEDIDTKFLGDIDNVNAIVPLTNNISLINKLVKRYSPEILLIPSLKGLELAKDEIKKGVNDINIVEESDSTLSFGQEEFNLEDDSITNAYFI